MGGLVKVWARPSLTSQLQSVTRGALTGCQTWVTSLPGRQVALLAGTRLHPLSFPSVKIAGKIPVSWSGGGGVTVLMV